MAATVFASRASRPSGIVVHRTVASAIGTRPTLNQKRGRDRRCGIMKAATPTGSGSEELGQYARKMRGEWSMEPAAALDRIVPELGGDKYKGQV